MKRLLGKVALITGAARGIGKQISIRFAAEGAFVCLTDIDKTEGTALADRLKSSASFMYLDVTKEDSWQGAIDYVLDQHKRIDILVNNAGILETGTIEDTDPTLWQHIMDVNTTGTFLGCQAAVRAMKKTGGGVIVNMASQAAVRPRPTTMAYAASKAAIVNLTKTVAAYCAEQGYDIRCNTVLPGAIDTEMIYKNRTTHQSKDEFVASVKARYPLGRMGTSKEIADGVVFLACDESRLMTGSQLRIDGGGTI